MIGRVLAAALAGLLALATVTPAAAREAIREYFSNIVVHADASLTVTETLRVWVEGRDIKRGIFRAFPTLYPDGRGGTVRVPFEVVWKSCVTVGPSPTTSNRRPTARWSTSASPTSCCGPASTPTR